ncbi:MAG: Rossmann fold nucleotide-binding protein involved in uptake-like protein, partial [Ilumatobacteraceae bacterium]|nr:Rossmann fold nucleotide-binding protein involved in uptake-like protein [Ilumatobacteraceae bacterium]
ISSVAAEGRMAVVSGLARGIDQAAMKGALDAGIPVIGVPTEGIRVAARSPEIRRRAHSGELCIASPYGPAMRFTAGNAMGRNKIIYALADVTLVVCSEAGSGGTWEGAREAMRRSFGQVAVWTGDGAGPGNAKLIELGGVGVSELRDVLKMEAAQSVRSGSEQPSLFD